MKPRCQWLRFYPLRPGYLAHRISQFRPNNAGLHPLGLASESCASRPSSFQSHSVEVSLNRFRVSVRVGAQLEAGGKTDSSNASGPSRRDKSLLICRRLRSRKVKVHEIECYARCIILVSYCHGTSASRRKFNFGEFRPARRYRRGPRKPAYASAANPIERRCPFSCRPG